MGLTKTSSKYTAFNTYFGTYKFLRLQIGLRTVPNTFQLLMDEVMHGNLFRYIENHLYYLREVFSRFKQAVYS